MQTQTPYHDDVYQRFIQDHGAGVEASSDAGDHTDLDCPIFNYPGAPTPSPGNPNAEMLAERSAVLVHEMWHHWQVAHDTDSSHIDGPRGSCTANGSRLRLVLSARARDPHFRMARLSDQLGSLNKTNVVNGIGSVLSFAVPNHGGV